MGTDHNNIQAVRAWLEGDVHARWKRVDADMLEPLSQRVAARRHPERSLVEDLFFLLAEETERNLAHIKALHLGLEGFNQRHASLASVRERRLNMLNYAEELGATAKQLKGDRKAFRRYFDQHALVARYQRRFGDLQRELSFLLEQLGRAAGDYLGTATAIESAWDRLDLERRLLPLLDFPGDPRVATAAFHGLSRGVRGLPAEKREALLGGEAIRTIYRLALDREKDTWIQCEALDLLRLIALETFTEVAGIRLADYAAGDDFFVRARLVPLVVRLADAQKMLGILSEDPRPFVRQALARALPDMPPEAREPLLVRLVCEDVEPAVRAAALLELPGLAEKGTPVEVLHGLLGRALREESAPYVLRVAIQVAADGHAQLAETGQIAWRDAVLPALAALHQRHEQLSVRRWAALARERIWCEADPGRAALRDRVQEVAQDIRPGARRRVRDRVIEHYDDVTLGRILGVAAQEDFGFDVVRGKRDMTLIRGHRFGRRLWRWWYEFRHPSPDKRQAFRHTIGRIFEGDLRVPSPLLSEMSQTKVPGEPYTLSAEAGWRPYLPLVDEVLSALEEQRAQRPLRIVTSEGVTTLRPPRSPLVRWRAQWKITLGFPELARLRNSDQPVDYVAALRALGIELAFQPHPESADEQVEKCYAHPALVAPLAWLDTPASARLREYFYSVYANSLTELGVFLAGVMVFFLGRHLWLNQVFFRLRRRVPLVVGGWGTRGKSGTERIKAALFNALGHRIVSKTTGCEAMFLYADTYGPLHELFLFRPYDKATIWEQVNIVNLCARLRGHVFLWECMGLTPSYIEIIQRHWMKDDLSTIVNTYPDHEDLQGPAGINIPEVMTCFIRRGGQVLTSEQQMTPVLAAEARRVDARLDQVGWLEPGLLTPDILERFPYEEHPNNIALVAEMGAQLGVAYDVSLKEMADRVVPDLGVLKVYPVAELNGRKLQFVNGCSANERFGALGNWQRLAFDQHDPCNDPGTWISVVVNNRADRIARSRVFASLLVEDIEIDKIFLIGSNLDGMQGYIREAFDQHGETISLYDEAFEGPEAVLREAARRLRVPADHEALARAVAAISEEGDQDATPWREALETGCSEYQAFAKKIGEASDRAGLDEAFRALCWTWFERKLVVIDDYFSTGDQTLHRICEETPPGYFNRIMGMQNIKGTGLDFVYRWQAWDQCYRACQQLVDRKPKVAREGLATLSGFKDFGLLCVSEVVRAAAEASQVHGVRDKGFQTQLNLILSNFEKTMATIWESISPSTSHGGWRTTCGASLYRFGEALFDAGDAVRRRKKADTIYRDMAKERISPARAAQEVQRLNKRQKGGWLKQDVEAWIKRRKNAGQS